jgi:hypothetical protein
MENIILLGAGALGARIALEIATPGKSMRVFDFDRVDDTNVASGATIYTSQHIGAPKATVLASLLYRRAGIQAWGNDQRVTADLVENYDYFHGAELVLDCFDNREARGLTFAIEAPVLHVAVSGAGTGVIAWNEYYHLPDADPGANPVCTHQLGRRLLVFTSAVASQVALEFLETGRQRNAVVAVAGMRIWS